MALTFYDFNGYFHSVIGLDEEAHHHHHLPPLPLPPPSNSTSIQIELTIRVTFYGYLCREQDRVTFFAPCLLSEKRLRFDLNLLLNRIRLRHFLAPTYARLRVNTVDTCFDHIVHQISECGHKIFANGYNRQVLPLRSEIRALVTRLYVNEEEASIDRATEESEAELERCNYGMVAAKESAVKEMLKRVRLEREDGHQDCTICFMRLKIGTYAYRMPCSHTFHRNCIRRWLKIGHHCPNCRFRIPTD